MTDAPGVLMIDERTTVESLTSLEVLGVLCDRIAKQAPAGSPAAYKHLRLSEIAEMLERGTPPPPDERSDVDRRADVAASAMAALGRVHSAAKDAGLPPACAEDLIRDLARRSGLLAR